MTTYEIIYKESELTLLNRAKFLELHSHTDSDWDEHETY